MIGNRARSRFSLMSTLGLIAVIGVMGIIGFGDNRVASGATQAAAQIQSGITVTLPITISVAGARWVVANNGGTTQVGPDEYQLDNSPGLTLYDCCAPDQYYAGKTNPAYDVGFTLRIGDPQVSNPLALPILALPGAGEVFSGTQRITPPPITLSGLSIRLEYYFVASAPVVRTLASFTNPGGAATSVQVYWASKEGMQDTERFVAHTSSGDATFLTNDRWVIIGDGSNASPVNTHVLYGLVNPPIIPNWVTQAVFQSGGENGGVGARFLLTVPPGATRRLMFFNQIQADPASALAAASAFNISLDANSDLVAGLDGIPHSEIVNWRDFVSLYLPIIQR